MAPPLAPPRLYLRQAYLGGVSAHDVNLRDSFLDRTTVAQQYGAATSLALSEDGSSLVVGTLAGEVRLWHLSDRTPVLLEKQTAPAWDVGLSADGKTVASLAGNAVHVWRTDASRPYERMDLTGAAGLNDIQRNAMLALGAFVSPT